MKRIILWKLGNLEKKLLPTTTAINKLRELIQNAPKEDDLHIVWGPELSCEVINVEDATHHIVETTTQELIVKRNDNE